MGFPDAILFLLLALGDVALLAYLRYRRGQVLKLDRMARCLRFAIERESRDSGMRRRHVAMFLQRAS